MTSMTFNDLNQAIKYKKHHFPHDTNFLYWGKSIKNLNNLVNFDLKKLVYWLSVNKISLNVIKTKSSSAEDVLDISLATQALVCPKGVFWHITKSSSATGCTPCQLGHTIACPQDAFPHITESYATYFNTGKMQLVSFDRSNNNGSIDGKIDRSVLEEKSSFKMLGLTFSSKLD